MSMDARARDALSIIRGCVAAGRYVVLPHFVQRLDERGLFWRDVRAVLDDPSGVRYDGHDRYDRAKWIVAGDAADDLPIEIVCVLDEDEHGNVTVFITIY